jgi:alkylation response protein AidB-like acyl-CoA dehydrogenase
MCSVSATSCPSSGGALAPPRQEANTESLQCHGGIGFTWEHDLHLWLKRGKALEGTYGSPRWHRARMAAELFAS